MPGSEVVGMGAPLGVVVGAASCTWGAPIQFKFAKSFSVILVAED